MWNCSLKALPTSRFLSWEDDLAILRRFIPLNINNQFFANLIVPQICAAKKKQHVTYTREHNVEVCRLGERNVFRLSRSNSTSASEMRER